MRHQDSFDRQWSGFMLFVGVIIAFGVVAGGATYYGIRHEAPRQEAHYKELEQEGYMCGKEGMPIEACPDYPHEARSEVCRDRWKRGWRKGWEDARKKEVKDKDKE